MKIMAVDYGDSRTGLAMCDKSEILATPLTIIHMKDFDICVEKVAEAVKENKAEMVVVGNPINMNGTLGPRAEKIQTFVELLQTMTDLPIVKFDERLTTAAAHRILNETNIKSGKRKTVIDTLSAQIILQNYLDANRNK